MKLYHGSTVNIDTIILDKSKPYKDFGKAFYLSSERSPKAPDKSLFSKFGLCLFLPNLRD